jgi:hypothetical protein
VTTKESKRKRETKKQGGTRHLLPSSYEVERERWKTRVNTDLGGGVEVLSDAIVYIPGLMKTGKAFESL